MRSSRILFLSVFVSSLAFIIPFGQHAAAPEAPAKELLSHQHRLRVLPALLSTYHRPEDSDTVVPHSRADEKRSGIRELVPEKYRSRYEQWKKDFLSTEIGQKQWNQFGSDPSFSLTIVVSRENAEGAGTGKYKWDAQGKLIAATITLGARLNEGYPNPIYYPVMNSLSSNGTSNLDKGILAASKIAHEFGHLARTSQSDSALYQLQSQLIPVYNKIFLSNGRNARDPRLLELERTMRGTPVEIWEDREYWGETNAMLYLRDRLPEDSLRCTLFSRIRQSVDLYAKTYADRFSSVARSSGSANRCGWQ